MTSLGSSFGLLGVLIFVAHIWAIFNILQSRTGVRDKLIWFVVVLVPFVGLVPWLLFGPRLHIERVPPSNP